MRARGQGDAGAPHSPRVDMRLSHVVLRERRRRVGTGEIPLSGEPPAVRGLELARIEVWLWVGLSTTGLVRPRVELALNGVAVPADDGPGPVRRVRVPAVVARPAGYAAWRPPRPRPLTVGVVASGLGYRLILAGGSGRTLIDVAARATETAPGRPPVTVSIEQAVRLDLARIALGEDAVAAQRRRAESLARLVRSPVAAVPAARAWPGLDEPGLARALAALGFLASADPAAAEPRAREIAPGVGLTWPDLVRLARAVEEARADRERRDTWRARTAEPIDDAREWMRPLLELERTHGHAARPPAARSPAEANGAPPRDERARDGAPPA